MNSHYETALDIKYRTNQNQNPFVLKIPSNSTSQEIINLSISGHILKKLSLINISSSKQNIQLYKESLLNLIQNPHLNIKDLNILKQVLFFIQYWHQKMGKNSSWPHTRTLFYYLQDKLRKNKLYLNLDYVKLKRAILEPNKKEFLSQSMGQTIHSYQLKNYILELKQSLNQNRSDFSNSKLKSQKKINVQQFQEQIMNQKSLPQINKNILYSDLQQDWNQINQKIDILNQLKKQKQNNGQVQQKLQQIKDIFESYLIQKINILLNNYSSENINKQQVRKQLNFRKNVLEKIQKKQLNDLMNSIILKVKFDY